MCCQSYCRSFKDSKHFFICGRSQNVRYRLHIPRESFYHAPLQTALGTAGFKAQSEYAIDQGRIDLVIDIRPAIYIIEIKFDAPAESALAQIKDKKYYERFVHTKNLLFWLVFLFKKSQANLIFCGQQRLFIEVLGF